MTYKRKIALVGGGNIGGTLAHMAALEKLGDIVVCDIAGSMAQGKALDLAQAGAVSGYDCTFYGGESYEALADAAVVIVTAGLPRKPGMSRDELVGANTSIVAKVADAIKKHAPQAFVIVVTNPLDAMVWVMRERTGFPSRRVVGMAGVLDCARLRHFLSLEMGISMQDITAMVLGGHGDSMVPLAQYSTVGGVPLSEAVRLGWLKAARLEEIFERTRKGGGEIVALLGTGSAFYAPAASALAMARAYLEDEKRLFTCAAFLRGEYGFKDVYAGVPAIIGKGGVERILELPLEGREKEAFARSVAAVRDVTKAAASMLAEA